MYSFLNDKSIDPQGEPVADSRPFIRELMATVFTLRQYQIERIRVPDNFANTPIAGSVSIAEFYQTSTDVEERNLILGFLANNVKAIPAENAQALQEAESKNLFDIYLDGSSSNFLKEAYVTDLPAVSLRTKPLFETDFLQCQQYILTENGEQTINVPICNAYHLGSHNIHNAYFLQTNHKITFATTRFDPVSNPCWRGNATNQILQRFNYPACMEGLSAADRRAINMQVASMILESNGWEFDVTITGLNNHRQEVWRIYTNRFSGETVYISIDLGEGEFEIQNRRGLWKRTVFFDGRDTGKNYEGQNTHNINIR